MSKHTPGPWIARRMACQTDSHTFNSEVVTSEGGECVVSLVRKADSQLIAAAPDMLEALEGILNSFHESVKTTASLDEFPSLKAVQAAIAKAKGVDREHSN